MNENILKAGFDLTPLILRCPKRPDGPLQGGGIFSADMQHCAKSHRLQNSWACAKFVGDFDQIRAAHRPCCESGMFDDFSDGSAREQFAARNVGEAMATLCFVHVMGGDQEGQSTRGQLM